jgi:hypothetical protein
MINISISKRDIIRGLLELSSNEVIDIIREIDHQVDNYQFTRELYKYFQCESCVSSEESNMDHEELKKTHKTLLRKSQIYQGEESGANPGIHLSPEECEKFHIVLTRLIDGIESDEIFHFDVDYAKELLEKLKSGV